MTYTVVERLPEHGLLRTHSREYGMQVWSITKRRSYKHQRCLFCRREIPANTEQTYRPLRNPGNRMHRICLTCAVK